MPDDIILAPNVGLSHELLELHATHEELKLHAQAANTRDAYKSDWESFCAWIEQKTTESPLKATQKAVSMYLTWLATTPYRVGKSDKLRTRKASAISRAATGILFKRHELGAPLIRTKHDEIATTLKAIRRMLGVAPNEKLPFLTDHLRSVTRTYGNSLADIRDIAVLLFGCSSANRRSEIADTSVRDVTFEPGGMTITIRKSKVDQEGVGRTIAVKHAKDTTMCPVCALKRWFDASNITTGPIFRGFTKTGEVRNSKLDGKSVAIIVKRACTRIGLDPALYSGHSLRAGFMTNGANKGMKLRQLMDQSGHKTPRVAAGYIRRAELFGDDNPTTGLFDE